MDMEKISELETVHVEFEKSGVEQNTGKLHVTIKDPETHIETTKVYNVKFTTKEMSETIQDSKMKSAFEHSVGAELPRLVLPGPHSYKILGREIEFELEEANETEKEENLEEANEEEDKEEEVEDIEERKEYAEEENIEEAYVKIDKAHENKEVIDASKVDATLAAQKKLNK